MLLIATAAAFAANAPAAERPAAPARQAQAVVRIVRPARVQLGEGSAGGDQQGAVRETSISDSDGQTQRAILVEFS